VLHGFALTSSPAVLYQATAPGPPGGGARRLLVLSVATSGGPQWVRTVWSWTNRIATVSTAPEGLSLTVLHADGAEDHHVATVGGWQITRIRDSAREYIVLDQVRQRTANVDTAGRRNVPAPYRLTRERLLEFELGEQNYRRSEESWKEAGRPTARVGLRLAPNELVVEISVHKEGELTFVPVGATNPYDNEHPDTNGDGIQLFLSDASGASGWVLVPERSAGAKQEPGAEAPVHVRTVEGWSTPRALHAVWHRTDDGYDVRVRVPEPATDSAGRFSLGVVVNEKSPQRARRRGQLVLGGGAGEFVYLRGDREDRDRLPVFEIAT
jgi:hypothetical protein